MKTVTTELKVGVKSPTYEYVYSHALTLGIDKKQFNTLLISKTTMERYKRNYPKAYLTKHLIYSLIMGTIYIPKLRTNL